MLENKYRHQIGTKSAEQNEDFLRADKGRKPSNRDKESAEQNEDRLSVENQNISI